MTEGEKRPRGKKARKETRRKVRKADQRPPSKNPKIDQHASHAEQQREHGRGKEHTGRSKGNRIRNPYSPNRH